VGAIYDEYWRQRGDLVEADKVPRSVSFSDQGFTRALHENDAASVQALMGPTYCGLPHMVDRKQTADVVVSDKTIEERRSRSPTRGPVIVRAGSVNDEAMTIEIVGAAPTEAQLCDVVMAHCQPRIDAGTQTPLQRVLHTAVQNFGRFE
jgi:hypothetical protein